MKAIFVFLATAPTGVLTAGTAGPPLKQFSVEGCCTFMEKRRRCTIAGITVLRIVKVEKNFFPEIELDQYYVN